MSFSTSIRAELQALGSAAGELVDLLTALESAEQSHGEQVVAPFTAARALLCVHKARRQLARAGEHLAAAGPVK